jgi:glycerate kinase
LVLTGEGSLDGQTLERKALAGVAAMARRLGRPII